ncbi:hypothetical protein MTCD1_01566 [Colwellia marinimaniae]|uniref:Uncharacterized protein n=2 Tax=Colwelliaceae TaxID=267889 RepID=A0ABQ0MUB8_9GAMM|nr:hypothetical protein MTCD1_01566 [Colwellia marinimaniae]
MLGQQLMAHVSNQHPLAQQLRSTDGIKNAINISLIFHGEDDYISPHDVSVEHSARRNKPLLAELIRFF